MEKNLILQKAQSAEMAHDFETAQRMYKQLLADEPSNVNYLKAMGGSYVQAKEDEKAIPYYEKIIEYYPHYIEAMSSLGAIFRRLKRYDDSIKILQRALQEDRQLPMVNYNLGFTYKEMGKYDEAIEAFNSVIVSNPNDVLAHNHLGSIYCALKDYPKSIAAYKRGLQIDPNHPILNYNLAHCYEASNNYSEAIRYYGNTLKTKPGWSDAIQDFSRLLIKCQKNQEAQSTVENAIKLYPNDVNLLLLLGEVYINEFDYDSAIKTYKKAKSVDGKNVDSLNGLANAYDKAGMLEQATMEIQSALELDSENVQTKKLYVNNLLSRGQLDDASLYLADLMKADGAAKDVQLLDLNAQYCICKGDDAKAEEYFGKIKLINHHYKDFMLNAARRYAAAEKYEKAEEIANKYVEQRPQNPDGFMALGAIYEKKGDFVGAKNFFSKSSSMRDVNVLAKKQVAGIADKIVSIENFAPLQELSQDEILAEEKRKEEEALAAQQNQILDDDADAQNEAAAGDSFDFAQMGDGSEKVLDDGEQGDYLENLASSIHDKFAKEEDDDFFEIQDPDNMKFADEETSFSFDQNEEEQNPLKDDEGGNFFGDFTADDVAKMQEKIEGSAENARDSADYAKDSADWAKGSAGYAKDSADWAKNSAAEAQDSAQIAREAAENAQALMNQLKEQQQMIQAQLLENQKLMNDQMKMNAQYMVKEAVCDFLETTPEPEPSLAEPVETTSDFEENATTTEENYAATEENEAIVEESSEISTGSIDGDDNDISEDLLVEPVETISEDTAASFEEEIPDQVRDDVENNSSIDDDCDNDGEDARHAELDSASPEISSEVMLDKIEKILQDDSTAEKNADKLELFKTLRVLTNFLPEAEKNTFKACRMRMMIEYIIAKLSGKPGLYKTTVSLLKSGVLGEESEAQLSKKCDQEMSNALISEVITNMKKLAEGLEDQSLAHSLVITADGILEQIELKNRQAEIF